MSRLSPVKKTWIRVVLAVVAVAALGLAWASQSGWLLGAAKDSLEKGLGEATGREVHVGRLTGGFSSWVWLHDLSLGPALDGRRPDVSVTAEALGLKLNWLRLVLHRRASLEDLRAVRVIGADTFVLLGKPSPSTPTAQGADPLQNLRAALANAPLPPVRITLGPARVWVQRERAAAELWLDQARLEAEPGPAAGELTVGVKGIGRGNAKLDFTASADGGLKRGRAQLRFSGLQVSALPPPAGVKLSAGTLEGELNLELRPDLVWQGQGRLKDLNLSWQGRPLLQSGASRWKLENQLLRSDEFQAQALGGRWKGEATLDLKNMSVTAKAATPGLELLELGHFAGAPDGLSLTGKAAASLAAAGALASPGLKLKLDSRAAQWRGQGLEQFEVSVERDAAAQAAVEARLIWPQGQAQVTAQADAQGRHQGNVSVEGLPAPWLQAWAGRPVKGTVVGTAHWQGSALGLTWEAKARSEQVTVGEMELRHVALATWGDSKAVRGRFEGDLLGWKGVNVDLDAARVSATAWSLKKVKVFVGPQLLLSGDGSWDRAGAADLRFKAGPWPAADLPGTRGLTALSGSAQAQGRLLQKDGRWSLEAHVEAPKLVLAGQAANFKADLTADPDAATISGIRFRDGEAAGEAGWRRGGAWNGWFELKDADLGALLGLAGASGAGLQGKAAGKIQWTRAAAGWLLDLDLSLAQAGPGRAQWNGRLDLGALQASQGKGSISAWKWGEGDWDAALEWGGGNGKPLWLQLKDMKLKGQAQPNLRVELNLPGLDGKAAWGPGLALEWQRVPTSSWAGTLTLSDQDPGLLMGARLGRPVATTARLGGTLLLEPTHLLVDLGGLGRMNGEWRKAGPKEPWTGQLQFQQLDLARANEVLQPVGYGLPLKLQGYASGQWNGVSLTAKAERLNIEDIDFGRGQMEGAYSGGELRGASLALGGNGPQLALSDIKLGRGKGGQGWTASAKLSAGELPYSLFVLGGEARLKLSGQDGEGRAALDFSVLQLGQRRIEAVPMDLQWKKGDWTLGPRNGKAWHAAGRVKDGDFILGELRVKQGPGSASLSGKVLHDGQLSFDGTASNFPVGDLTGVLDWPQAWRGDAYGTVSVRGTTETPRTVISIKVEDGSVQGFPFDLALATVHVEDGWVKLAPLGPVKVSKQDAYALEVEGRVPVKGPLGLDVKARLKEGGLGFFAGTPFIRDAQGPLQMELLLSGSKQDPTVNGSLRIVGGSVTPTGLFPALEKLDLFVQIRDSQVQLQQAQARVVGDGPLLKLELADAGRPAFVLERWEPQRFNLRLRASKSGLPVRSTDKLRFLDGTVHPDLRLQGGWQNPAVSGDLTLERGELEKALVTWPAQFNPPRPEGRPGDEPGFLDRVEWDLGIHARQDVMLRNQAAQVFIDTGDAGLRLRGMAPHRSLEGRLSAVKGNVDYLLASFELDVSRPSWVEFRGEDPPVLELWGLKRVRDAQLYGQTVRRDVEVHLHAHGPLGEVQMQLSSDDTALTQDQLASLAGLGIDSSDPRNQTGFARLLSKAPSALLGRYARRTGMLDDVGLRLPVVEDALNGRSATAATLSPSTKTLVELSGGKWISEKLYVGMSGLLNETRNSKGSSVDPALGGKVEYQLKNDARLSAQHSVDTDGQTEQRVMLERASSFENYNARKRRWGQPTPVPTPQRTPSPETGASSPK
jgi:hypothetical protein